MSAGFVRVSMNKIRTETSTQNKECGSRSVGEIMAAVVPEDLEMGVVLSVVMEEVPARSEEAEVLGETGVVQGVVVEEVPARSEEAEVLVAAGGVQGVVVGEGLALTNESLRDWVNRWCSGDRGGLPPISTWNTSQVTDMSELF